MPERTLVVVAALAVATLLSGCGAPEPLDAAPALDPQAPDGGRDASRPSDRGGSANASAAAVRPAVTLRFDANSTTYANACPRVGCDVYVGAPAQNELARPSFIVDVAADVTALVTVTLWLNWSVAQAGDWTLTVERVSGVDAAGPVGEATGSLPVTLPLDLSAGQYAFGWGARDAAVAVDGQRTVLVHGPVFAS